MQFKRSFLAGIALALATAASLACSNTVVGQALFSVGLITIIYGQLWLYTGRIGFTTNIHYLKQCFFILCGNLAGAILAGELLGYCCPQIVEPALAGLLTKMDLNAAQMFIGSLFCGMLVYMAVILATSYTGHESPVGLTAVLLCVMAFVVCGFGHCVAMASQMGIASTMMSINDILKACSYVGIAILGNSVGSIIFYQMHREVQKD